MLTWTARAPARWMRSASKEVSWSPSITQTSRVGASSAMVRSSSEVLPEPGELIRLTARIRRTASQAAHVLGQVVVAGQHPLLEHEGVHGRVGMGVACTCS